MHQHRPISCMHASRDFPVHKPLIRSQPARSATFVYPLGSPPPPASSNDRVNADHDIRHRPHASPGRNVPECRIYKVAFKLPESAYIFTDLYLDLDLEALGEMCHVYMGIRAAHGYNADDTSKTCNI